MSYEFKLVRSSANPILKPSDNWWESVSVCNPGVVQLDGEVHMIYSAKGEDGVSRLGYAKLAQAEKVVTRLPYPVFYPEAWFEKDSVEDPRLCLIDDVVYMLYAGKERDMARVCESYITLQDFVNCRWSWSEHRLLLPNMVGIHDRNAAYFPRKINGRYVLLHRPMMMTENIWVSFSYDRRHWYGHREILKPREGYWDDAKIGIAGPPHETEAGWLLLYHGVEAKTWTYRLGFVILDKQDPTKVIYRCEEPILEPEMHYEREGVTPNVVFSCGSFLQDNKLVVYYGAADKVICVAYATIKW